MESEDISNEYDVSPLKAMKKKKKKKEKDKDERRYKDEEKVKNDSKSKKRKEEEEMKDAGDHSGSKKRKEFKEDEVKKKEKKHKSKKEKESNEDDKERRKGKLETSSESDQERSKKKKKKKEKKRGFEMKEDDERKAVEDSKATAGEKDLKPEIGQWQNAQFESSAQKDKFIRLLGGFKNADKKSNLKQPSIMSGLKKFSSIAMDSTEEEKLNKKLEHQYEQAFDTTRMKRGQGLGYDATQDKDRKSFHIDKNSSNSTKLE